MGNQYIVYYLAYSYLLDRGEDGTQVRHGNLLYKKIGEPLATQQDFIDAKRAIQREVGGAIENITILNFPVVYVRGFGTFGGGFQSPQVFSNGRMYPFENDPESV